MSYLSDFKSKLKGNGWAFSILMGFLALVITPIAAAPLFLLMKISDSFDPAFVVVFVARKILSIFGIHDIFGLADPFIAQYIIVAFFVLLGAFFSARISWRVNQSKNLSAVTFASAILIQLALIGVLISIKVREISEQNRQLRLMHERDDQYRQYAKIGAVTVDAQDPTQFQYAESGILTSVTLFKKLVFNIPVTVTHAGTYDLFILYSSNSHFSSNSNPSSEMKQFLDVGEHMVRMELVSKVSPGHGYESPQEVHGKILISSSFLLSAKEAKEERDLLQSITGAKGDEDISNLNAPVSKPVEARKEIQF